ncbi:MAG: substrate-binding domain-containing protein [Anaerolineae bacterium]
MLTQGKFRPSSRPTIGVVMRAFGRPDYDLWLGVIGAARQRDLNVVTFTGRTLESPVSQEREANAIYELISDRQLSGAILMSSGLGIYVGADGLRAFCTRLGECPLVSLQMILPGIPSIVFDNYHGMRRIVDHLIEDHGYRRIAFVRGPVTHRGACERYRAYLESLADHDISLDPDLVTAPSAGWSNTEGIAQFLETHGRSGIALDAVVGASGNLALETHHWLTSHGIRIPEDVALAGFDDFPNTSGMLPPLTTVRTPYLEMGRRAVDLVLDQIRGEPVPEKTILPPHALIRQSCGCSSHRTRRASCFDPGLLRSASPRGDETSQIQEVQERLEACSEALVEGVTARVDRYDCAEDERLHSWMAELVDVYLEDLSRLGVDADRLTEPNSAFLSALRRLLRQLADAGCRTETFQDLLSELRRRTAEALTVDAASTPAGPGGAQFWAGLEDLFSQARVVASEVAHSVAVSHKLSTARRIVTLTHVGHTLTTVADFEELKETLAQELPTIGVPGCYLTLYEDPRHPRGWATLRFAHSSEQIELPPQGLRFPAPELLPPDVMAQLASAGPINLCAEPLFVRDKQFGFLLMEVGPQTLLFEQEPEEGTVYDLLRGYISDALHGILLYEEALRARQQAEEADRLKSRFLSTVSHELRTPLNLIVSLSEMLLWEQRGDQEELARIHASAQHLDGLIRDVLDLASSQVGQLRLVRESLDLKQALSVVAMIGQQMAADKGLGWSAEMPDQLPRVRGDRTRLRQVALNLVSNALRFTSEGEVRLEVAVDENELVVSVSDTGIGVSPEEQDVIFDEFRQSERTTARGYGGLGLGLAISRRLVEMHGGAMGVHSSGVEGEGATFYFTLPTIVAEEEVVCGDGDRKQRASRSVVVLSSDGGSGRDLTTYLTERGYEVREIQVSGGGDAEGSDTWLNQVIESPPRAVILDMEPALEQGWVLMKVLKGNPETRNTPVFFYSLMQNEDSGSMLAFDYLSKPVSAEDLVRVLERQGVASRECDAVPTSATILLVDDQPDILATHAWLLQSQLPGTRILQATNGRQALALMAEIHPDLVLLDLMMPEMSGFEVIAEMQSHPDLCSIPIVVLTAKTLGESALADLNQGVTAVLGKGLFSAEETFGRLEAALQRSAPPSLETQMLVRRAMAYIHEHYMEPITRKEIAAHVNVSARHLDRCFSDETGITPIDYLNRFRLRQARRLLRSNTLNISEIAAAVGFSDSSYFSRVFSREVGMSPSDFRRAQA